MSERPMLNRRVIVVHPHGFCSGVARAVATADSLLARNEGPVYGFHEIVHNAQVTSQLAARGMRPVERMADVPVGAVVLLSAHGVAPAVRAEAEARHLQVIDATCPFVAKVHREVLRFVAEGCTVLCVGHHAHAEVIGIAGESPDHVLVVESVDEARQVQPPDPGSVALVTQTTLSPEMADGIRAVLRARFPALRQPEREDVCYATRNRQQAVRTLAAEVELVLVLGSSNSSNTLRLVETARKVNRPAQLVGSCANLETVSLNGIQVLGVASGASTPESFLTEVLTCLVARGFTTVEHLHAVPERTRTFPAGPPPGAAQT